MSLPPKYLELVSFLNQTFPSDVNTAKLANLIIAASLEATVKALTNQKAEELNQ
jgi:hypothetical protein